MPALQREEVRATGTSHCCVLSLVFRGGGDGRLEFEVSGVKSQP